jgi:hypothetical protein
MMFAAATGALIAEALLPVAAASGLRLLYAHLRMDAAFRTRVFYLGWAAGGITQAYTGFVTGLWLMTAIGSANIIAAAVTWRLNRCKRPEGARA